LTPLERSLATGALAPVAQQVLLVAAGVVLALLAGLVSEILLSWILGPDWASSLGLMAVLAGLFWSLAARNDDPAA
jgi:protein-S-isoprenylcysteine O-methyltransferase Ste14